MKSSENTIPILKSQIFGFPLDINYQEDEKDKLLKIIEKVNNRFKIFDKVSGKVGNNKLLALTILKIEDELHDSKSLIKDSDKKNLEKDEKLKNFNQMINEIIKLKDQIESLKNKCSNLENINYKAFNEIEKIEQSIIEINTLIISKLK